MCAHLRICGARGIALVLASGAAISLTAVTGGIGAASAMPGATTTTNAPVPAPRAPLPTYVPPPLPPPPLVTHEAPPPPLVTHEAPPPPPVTHEAPPPPPVTHEAPPPPPVTHEAPPPPPTTQAPEPTYTPPPTHIPEQTNAPATITAPVTTTMPAPTTQSRSTTAAGPLPTAIGPLPTVASSAAVSVPNSSARTTAVVTTSGAKSPAPSTVTQARQTTTATETPKTLQPTAQNFEIAKNSVPQVVKPTQASQADIQDLTKKLTYQANQANSSTSASPTLDFEKKSQVKQWDPKWVQTNQFYQPVIINPFPNTLQVVYVYNGAPQILMIPPLASAITELAQIGVYSFTAMVLDAAGVATSVAVGTMYGGGYVPAPGEPPPPPPPPPVTYDDVPVQVQYSEATYQPFVVHQIVDAGMDPAVGEEKVLLDGVTPAWGVWQQNDNGDRMFVVHKTQQYPGMDDPPGEGPLPGDYPLQLASASKPASSGLSTKDLLLIGAACLVLVLGAGAIILNVVMGRRRQPRH